MARDELGDSVWDNQRRDWKRPPVDREVLKELSERSTVNGLFRIGWFVFLLTAAAVGTVLAARVSLLLAVPVLYAYYFLYGFWVAIGHELQHGTVFAAREAWLSRFALFVIQTIMWNSPTYAVVSHRLHHRYTMVRGHDPETDWPEVITTGWLRREVWRRVARMLVVGAVVELYTSIRLQVERAAGKQNWMMREHCTEKENRAIRFESLAILSIHAAVVASAILLRRWELLLFVTIAWQIGSAFEEIWHLTKHIGRPYNVNDHRLNTRSVRVSRFIRTIFWGLDDHVDHHLYPAVPSRNLPRLHTILEKDLPDPDSVFGCWAEMFEIAKAKDRDPGMEFVAVAAVRPAGQ